MATLTVFLSSIPYVKAVRSDGKELPFREGKYMTDDQGDIDFLNGMVKDRHPHISVPAATEERTIESEMLNPMVALEARLRQKIMTELAASAASGDSNRELGETKQDPLKPQNSNDIANATLGGPGMTFTPVHGQSPSEKLAAMKLAHSHPAGVITPPPAPTGV